VFIDNLTAGDGGFLRTRRPLSSVPGNSLHQSGSSDKTQPEPAGTEGLEGPGGYTPRPLRMAPSRGNRVNNAWRVAARALAGIRTGRVH